MTKYFTLCILTAILGFACPILWLVTIFAWWKFATEEFDYEKDRI